MNESVIDQIRSLLSEQDRRYGADLTVEELAASSLVEMGVSSMQIIRVIMRLEETFDVEFDREELIQLGFQTLAEIADLIQVKKASGIK